MKLPIFIDIDGTLTLDGEKAWGCPRESAIESVKHMLTRGEEVVFWSARGTTYAKAWAERLGLTGKVTCIGKPSHCYDDNPTIRPGGLKVFPPERLPPI